MKNRLVLIKYFLISSVYFWSIGINSQTLYEGEYQWRIPGGNYIDPTSFFSIHTVRNSSDTNTLHSTTKKDEGRKRFKKMKNRLYR